MKLKLKLKKKAVKSLSPNKQVPMNLTNQVAGASGVNEVTSLDSRVSCGTSY